LEAAVAYDDVGIEARNSIGAWPEADCLRGRGTAVFEYSGLQKIMARQGAGETDTRGRRECADRGPTSIRRRMEPP